MKSQPPDPFDQIRAALSKLEARPGLAKAASDPRSVFRCQSHAAFVSAVDYLLTRPGWSLRAIAREMGCDHTTLSDWLNRGDQPHSQIPAWALAALPAEARAVFMRHMLGWAESPLARVG
jgi:lambda repressor-like predicted transcriptional regulator